MVGKQLEGRQVFRQEDWLDRGQTSCEQADDKVSTGCVKSHVDAWRWAWADETGEWLVKAEGQAGMQVGELIRRLW